MIPHSLVIRSLPVNLELLDLLKTNRMVQNPSQIEISAIEESKEAKPARGKKWYAPSSEDRPAKVSGGSQKVDTGKVATESDHVMVAD